MGREEQVERQRAEGKIKAWGKVRDEYRGEREEKKGGKEEEGRDDSQRLPRYHMFK